jgi:hypothetical protein
MNTDDLIIALARHPETVDPRSATLRLALGAGLGAVAAIPLTLGLLGLNPVLAADAGTSMFWLKLAFVAAIAAAGWQLVRRLAQPGAAVRGAARAMVAPVLAMAGLAALVLVAAGPHERLPLVLGSSWNSCPFNIALLAAPALALMLFIVRTLAPTRLRLAGAATGLLAGALGALAYVLHCPELEAPFLVVWYLLGMLIPAGIGALVGPRVLHW